MRVRLLPIIVGLAIGFAVPAFAQEVNTVDPEVRQQIEAVTMKREEAYNKYDLAAWTAFYMPDATDIWSWLPDGGASVGRINQRGIDRDLRTAAQMHRAGLA